MKKFWKYVPWGTDVEEYDSLDDVKRDIHLAYTLGAEEQAYAVVTEDDVVIESLWEDEDDRWVREEPMLGMEFEEVLDRYACGR